MSDKTEKILLVDKVKKRHSQACDRCRLKKIKCDGLQPCSQCSKIGYNCITSDKLTRRGLPKGYTELLEKEVVKLQQICNEIILDETLDRTRILEVLKASNYKSGESTGNANGSSMNNNENIGKRKLASSSLEVSLENETKGLKYEKGVREGEEIPDDVDEREERTDSLKNNNAQEDEQDGGIFAFINDTFHYYNNYYYVTPTQEQFSTNFSNNYLGHATWHLLNGNIHPSKASEDSRTKTKYPDTSFVADNTWLREFQIDTMVEILQLNSQFLLPQFLLVRYKYNMNQLKELLELSLEQFFKSQNSLIPLLYPLEFWKEKLLQQITLCTSTQYSSVFNTMSNNPISSPSLEKKLCVVDNNPIILLTLIFIIQINWSCLDDYKLYQCSKIIFSTAAKNLSTFQSLLLSTFYFMGSCDMKHNWYHDVMKAQNGDAYIKENKKPKSQKNLKLSSNLWATEFLHIVYSHVLDMGLFINYKNLIPMTFDNSLLSVNKHSSKKNKATNNNNSLMMIDNGTESSERTIVAFWCFQFLDSWWSLIQGLPKSNFLINEFHPKSIKNLGLPQLKAFSLILEFIVNTLDGCNMLHTLSNGGRHKLAQTTEQFHNILQKWKLYHSIKDHEELHESQLTTLSTSEYYSNLDIFLTKPDIVEIQLTLYYLIMALFADTRMITRKHSDQFSYNQSFDTFDESNKNNRKSGILPTEEISYEIISIYLLLLLNKDMIEQPQQFNVLHILPCDSLDLIKLCLHNLYQWSISPQQPNESDHQVNWKFNKFQKLLTQWCQLWYLDETKDPLLQKLVLGYKLKLEKSGDFNDANFNLQKIKYFTEVVNFNAIARTNLVKSSSHANMNQFNIFENMNMDSRFMSPLLNSSIKLPLLQESKSFSNLNGNNSNNNEGVGLGLASTNFISGESNDMLSNTGANGSINLQKYKSRPIFTQDETDDGYAEDDDEDDDDSPNNAPLEFNTARRSSLFHQKHNQPPVYHKYKENLERTKQVTFSKDPKSPTAENTENNKRKVDHIILNEEKDQKRRKSGPISAMTEIKPRDPKYSNDEEHAQDQSERIYNAEKYNKENIYNQNVLPPLSFLNEVPPSEQKMFMTQGSLVNKSGSNSTTLIPSLNDRDKAPSPNNNSSINTRKLLETPRTFLNMFLLNTNPSSSNDKGSPTSLTLSHNVLKNDNVLGPSKRNTSNSSINSSAVGTPPDKL
ncbi:Protein SIP4 [Nakaseomyces bracarensis]|uniref:Protein SIP4 n=1 Tax=Nakaseomyces bracarensis TaxID=273131 RepID=A0ABR4NUU7_9SACH